MMLLFCICVGLWITLADGQTEIALLPARESLHVTAGSNVSVVCVVTGLSGKTVRWDHAGKLIANVAPKTVVYSDLDDKEKYLIGMAAADGGNFTFTLLGYSNDDAGLITCGVAKVESVNIRLETLVIPDEFYMTIDSPHREKVLNDTHSSIIFDLRHEPSISCVVTNSQPEAIITWLWNAKEFAMDALNITNDKQTAEDLHNVTSTILLPTHYLRPPTSEVNIVSEAVSENITVIELPDLEENFISDETIEIDEVARVVEEREKTHGVLSCKAAVGDRIYVESRVVDFTDYGNSGAPLTSKLWIVVLTYVVIALKREMTS